MIKIELVIEIQISGNNVIQRTKIISGRKPDGIGDETAFKLEIPCQGVSPRNYSRIHNNMQPVEDRLIIFYHNKSYLQNPDDYQVLSGYPSYGVDPQLGLDL